jgi:hypothetical protein
MEVKGFNHGKLLFADFTIEEVYATMLRWYQQ